MKTTVKINSIFQNGNHQMLLLENQSWRVLELEQEKEYSIEIKELKSTRSIQQNKQLWKNLQLISKELNQDLMKTYCDLLEEADVKSDFIITAVEMETSLRKTFRGVRFIRMQEVNDKDCYVYKVYLGSSKMNTKECSELLSLTFDKLYELGLEQ